MPEIAGIIAFGLAVAAIVPYTIEILQGKVKPERVSWFIWMLLGITYLWTAIVEGGAVLFTVGELVGPVVAFLLALKYGVGGKSRFDMVMLVLALAAVVWLLLTDNSLVGIILALVADGIAAVLTIRKLHVDPSSESRWAWAITAASGVFAILSLANFTLETLLFPAYIIALSTYIALRARPASKRDDAALEKL